MLLNAIRIDQIRACSAFKMVNVWWQVLSYWCFNKYLKPMIQRIQKPHCQRKVEQETQRGLCWRQERRLLQRSGFDSSHLDGVGTFLALLSCQVGKFRNFNINIINNPNTSSFNNPNIATSRALNVPAQKVKPWMLYFICHTLDPNKSRQHLTLKEKNKW